MDIRFGGFSQMHLQFENACSIGLKSEPYGGKSRAAGAKMGQNGQAIDCSRVGFTTKITPNRTHRGASSPSI